VNYLLLEALNTYAEFCNDVMMTTPSRDTDQSPRDTATSLTLSTAAADIRRRLADIFLLNSDSERPLHAGLSVCLFVCSYRPLHCMVVLLLIVNQRYTATADLHHFYRFICFCRCIPSFCALNYENAFKFVSLA